MKPIHTIFLYHSGVLVETERHQLFFDVHFDDEVTKATLDALIKDDKQPIFFVSHSHRDHFEPQILEVDLKFQPIYVFSNDVKQSLAERVEQIIWVGPDQTLTVDGIIKSAVEIKTFNSTDLGVAFVVRCDGISIFHSGDLNWWHWKSASQNMQIKEEKDYKSVMDQVVKESIDLAFVPTDPRLEAATCWAAEYFSEHSNAKWIVPIHFGREFEMLKLRVLESKLKDEKRLIIPSHRIERLL